MQVNIIFRVNNRSYLGRNALVKLKSIMNLFAMRFIEAKLEFPKNFSFSIKNNLWIMQLSTLIMVSYEMRKYSFKSFGWKKLKSNRK